MKKWIVICLLLLVHTGLRAQTWEEWFRQKETQIKYLVEQIGAFRVYAGYVKKGYDIAQKGLDVIHRIKEGDFSLHEAFMTSLSNVNPRIANYGKVAATLALQVHILQVYQKHRRLARQEDLLTGAEKQYCTAVFAKLPEGCRDLLEQLLLFTRDGEMDINDGERIRHIDALYADMLDRYAFARDFAGQAARLALSREREKRGARMDRQLYGIH